jgi:H+/Cl- antiporter ClcA
MPAVLAAVILGVVAGLLGVVFVYTNKITSSLRKKYTNSNWKKVLEVAIFAALTSLSFFLLINTMSRCAPLPNT